MRTLNALALLLVVITLRAEGAALLENGSFEHRDADKPQWPASWTTPASPDDQPLEFSSEHYEGAAGGMIAGDRKPHAWRQAVLHPSVRTFSLTAMVKADAAAIEGDDYAFLYGHILYKGRPYADATHFFARLSPGTYDWTRVTASAAANRDDPIDSVQVTVSGKFRGGRIVVDQVSLDPDAAATPEARLLLKVADLLKRIDEVGASDDALVECRSHLSTAAALLGGDNPHLEDALAEWTRAAGVLRPPQWMKLYPELASAPPSEARMIYHGQAATRQGCDRNLDIIQRAGANAVYLSLGSWMSLTYPSELLPTAADFNSDDTLAYFIEQAHQRGIKVFGYIAAFYGTFEPPDDPGGLYAKHPDWFARSPDARMPVFPDPANDEAAAYIVKVYADLARRYPLDGIGLDYIRYPTPTALNYDVNNRQRIMDQCGFDIAGGASAWQEPARREKVLEYRAETTRRVVERVRDAVKLARPGVALIACLISDPEEAEQYGQRWTKSAALLDYATPMNYDDISANASLMKRQREVFTTAETRFIAAIGGMPEVHQSWTISTWATRVAAQRKAGSDGIIIYRLGDLDPAVVSFLGNGAFYGKADFPAALKKRGE